MRVITCFGSAMILTPILSLFLGPKHAVIITILMESAMAVVFIVKEKLNFEIRHIFVGGIAGIIVIDIITLASFSISGYVTVDLLLLLISFIPFLLIAYVVGKYVLTFTHPEKLKRIILFTTLFAGVIAIWNFLPWW